MNAIDQRFDQPSAKMESLLIKTPNSQDKSEELNFMEKLYNDDVNISILTGIIVKIKELPNPEWVMIKEVSRYVG